MSKRAKGHKSYCRARVRKEGCRTSVWKLQAHFAIVRGLARFWDRQTLQYIMKACIKMHNMIVEDERDESLSTNYDAREGECSDLVVSCDHAKFQNFIQNHLRIRDTRTHS